MTQLFNMPLEDALEDRWKKGIKEVRGKSREWVGNPPMEEAYEEVLDIINYAREAYNQGHVKEYEAYYIEREAKGLAQTIRMYISDTKDSGVQSLNVRRK